MTLSARHRVTHQEGAQMKHDDRVRELFAAASGGINRRDLIKRGAALGVGVTALGMGASGTAAAPATRTRRVRARGQEIGGTVIVGTSQEAINYNPLLYA